MESKTYSLIFNAGKADEFIEENELTLEDANAQIEEIIELDPNADVGPLCNPA